MSTLNVSNITDGTTTVGTSYVVNGSAKAWVNFNGEGTIAARDSFNVSSLTDNGTGSHAYNLTNAMNNANYMCGSNAATTGINTTVRSAASIPSSVSIVLIGVRTTSNSDHDAVNTHGSIHGDLA